MSTTSAGKQYTKEQAEIRALIKSVDKAHQDKEAAAIVARYAPGAVVCDLAPPLFHLGMNLETKAAWLETWEGAVNRESSDLHTTVRDDIAFCHGCYRLSGTPKAAGRPISFWMHATVCLERLDGVWKIAHEHSSVPFYMDGRFAPGIRPRTVS